MSSWKRLEKETAKILGGRRISRGDNFSQSKPDIEHPLLSVECKYRKKISGFLKDGIRQASRYAPEKIPCLVLKERGMRGGLILLRLSDFQDLFGSITLKGDKEDE
jgi:hypothetical protein